MMAIKVPYSRQQNVSLVKLRSISWNALWRRMMAREPTGQDFIYPAGPVVYAVGDVHGRADLLAKVQQQIDMDHIEGQSGDALEIYLGDYIDRGPESSTVIEKLINRGESRSCVFLRGNHDLALLEFLRGQLPFEYWKQIGGAATVQSYGVSASQSGERIRRELSACLPPAHLTFLEHLPYFEVVGPYLFVHAGIRPGLPIGQQEPGDLLNIRDDFLDYSGRHEHIVVHGHTPTMAPELKSNRINIDTGAFATNRLTCLKIDQDGARVL